MFIDLTPEQIALRDELRSYFATLISAEEHAAMLTERHGTVYREIVRRMGRDGWLGVGWPAEFGGRGLGQVEQQIFVSEAARADVPLPSVTLQTVGPTLQAHGTQEQKDFFLPRMLSGRVDPARHLLAARPTRWLLLCGSLVAGLALAFATYHLSGKFGGTHSIIP